MHVAEIMTKNPVTCARDEAISKVLSLMRSKRIHQIPVMDGTDVAGLVTLDTILRKEVDPSTTSAGALMVACPTVAPSADVERAAELILNANVRAIPVYDTELRGIISETDIVKALTPTAPLSDVMKEAVTVDAESNVGTVREIMRTENVSRVPVVKNGKCTGIVGALELIALLEPGKERFGARTARGRDRGYKEPLNLNQTPLATFMREPVILSPDASLNAVLEKLRTGEEVLVQNSSLHIVTPKDVLRLVVKPKKLAYLQITGLDDDALAAAKIHQAASATLRRISSVTEAQPMKIVVETTRHSEKGKTQYFVHVQLPTQIGTFVSTKSKGWNLATVAQQSMNNLEREFWKKYEQTTQRGRTKKTKELRRSE